MNIFALNDFFKDIKINNNDCVLSAISIASTNLLFIWF